ncbi:hypothetical protein SAMN04489724_0644 [Algoriphagus locisalis]|uniref:Uncharacterized protein n=1 Tax=Algoriphagus locisalis TaxID=305507 RepID=A0A1I6XSA8_9BACT|nr:hypothetical protein [Algoriphagus locisalis]SFT41258.1 hypothetical protein SAMN04489724_0644 [Algoriphagus locisalis]
MQTITLKVSESAYDQLMRLLKTINPKELEIINENFNTLQAEVVADYHHAKKNDTTSLSIEELEKELSTMLEKYDT